jgi:ribosome biogenesis GTPase
MAKRKLNRRQQWRIEKIQQERLARARKKQQSLADNDNALSDKLEDSLHHGVVVSHYGATLDIEDESSRNNIRCALRQNIESIVCGDRIVWQKIRQLGSEETLQGVVTALEQRSSVLARPDFTGQMKPVAANIDQILIVTSPVPEFNEGLIDRYLVAAELSRIKPAIILNKVDMLNSVQKDELEQRISVYRNIGYSVIYTSCITRHGLDDLYQQLNGKTSVLVGQSGVGKSSLVNAILPEANIKTAEVSQFTNKGTHTTSVSRLYHLQNDDINNANLIDSPGVREFGLWDITIEQVIDGFIDLQPFAGQCRFRDCKHMNEPGCAILEAVAVGKVNQSRFQSYHRIVESLDS